MGVDIQFSQSYHWLNSWILANIIQLATQDFYDRFVDYHMDPGRRLYDQTVMGDKMRDGEHCRGNSTPFNVG